MANDSFNGYQSEKRRAYDIMTPLNRGEKNEKIIEILVDLLCG